MGEADLHARDCQYYTSYYTYYSPTERSVASKAVPKKVEKETLDRY